MKISTQLTAIIAAIFAVYSFSVAITAFSSLGEIAEPVKLADAKGFAWFWAFLGAIATAFGAMGVWLLRTQKDGEDSLPRLILKMRIAIW